MLLWQRGNSSMADRIVGDTRETFWDVEYAGHERCCTIGRAGNERAHYRLPIKG